MSKFFTKKEISSLSIFEKKDRIQQIAFSNWKKTGHGLLAMATGTGKSRVAILAAHECIDTYPLNKILLVVPTEKLRDVNWKAEFEKWPHKEGLDIYSIVERTCYASLHKIKNQTYGLVILDEAHNITENHIEFFENNSYDSIIALTATQPKEKVKRQILNVLCPTVFIYQLDEAVEDGIVTPYEIYVIHTKLNDKDRSYAVKTKDKEFYATEKQRYDFLSKQIDSTRQKMAEYTSLCNNIVFDDFVYTREEFDAKCLKMKKKEFEEVLVGFIPEHQEELKNYKTNKNQLEFWKKRHTFQMLDRMRFIYNLKSKTQVAKYLLNEFMDLSKRTLVFCGSINQANELCDDAVFHSDVKDTMLVKFQNEELDLLGCVDALNEGHNIPNVYQSLITQVNSNNKDLIQRIGRTVRWIEDMIANIFLVCCDGTQDEVWIEKATSTLDKTKIHHITFEQLTSV